MTNLTISLDESIVKKARIRAIHEGTSVSAKVREFLQSYVRESEEAVNQKNADTTTALWAAMALATPQINPNATFSANALPTNQRETAPVKMRPATPAQTQTDGGQNTGRWQKLREDLYADDFRARDRLERQPNEVENGKTGTSRGSA